MEQSKRKILLSALSMIVWFTVLLAATFTWFVNNRNAHFKQMFFQSQGDLTAMFSTWYRPVSELLENGEQSYDTVFRLATNPLSPNGEEEITGVFSPEQTDTGDVHNGTFGHELKYIRPGDTFRFHVRVTRPERTDRGLTLRFENIRQITYALDGDGNVTGILEDPYDDPEDPTDLSCLFSAQIIGVTPVTDASTQPIDANQIHLESAYFAGDKVYLDQQTNQVLELPINGGNTSTIWDKTAENTLDIWIEIGFLDERTDIATSQGVVRRTANDYQSCALRIGRLVLSSAEGGEG